MTRRLLGPVGGPVMFFLIAALVFAGLGWVTVVALRVERAQREAAAQAELGNDVHVALWRLDGRMLPALGVEDSRPFYHYASADPLSGSTTAPTPLLAAPLPDWMKLHVQLDPATGWTSPQVLSPEAQKRVSEAWPDLPLENNTAERSAVLVALNDKYPAFGTCDLLTARERAISADDRPFAAPMFDPPAVAAIPRPNSAPNAPPSPATNPTPLPPAPAGAAAPPPFRLFGWELPHRDAVASNQRPDDLASNKKDAMPAQQAPPGLPGPPANPPSQAPVTQGVQPSGAVGGRGNATAIDNDTLMQSFRNRTGTISRGVDEAKKAGRDFPMFGKNQGQLGQNFVNPPGNNLNTVPGGPSVPGPTPPGTPTAPSLAPGVGALPVPGPVPPAAPVTNPLVPGAGNERADKDGKPMSAAPDPSGDRSKQKDADAQRALSNELRGGSILEHIAGVCRRRDPDDLPPQDNNRKSLPPSVSNDRGPQNSRDATNLFNNSVVTIPPAVNIHLGSMRPQWITAADGTETLVLLRAAKIDQKTVYQGVVLDWGKLEQVLKEEVRDLFPDAALVPVRDAAGVSPDRAMTSLPVQLDPGPVPPLPSAGWTPLRFGLVLAWVAALVAFAAVGLSGWSLVDLAERRIRFVSAVTHELRTPLTSLRLYIDLLLSGMIQDEAKRQEYLNTLATESDRLHRLIDNVLDFAKLEKRRANGDMRPVKVGDLLDQLRGTWTDRVGADGKELVIVSTLAAELEVCTDAAMVQQIVGNLIDNARKYTRDADDKRIWLWAKPGGADRIVFEVEDRGPGVPAGERKSIFKPFRRGTHADARAGGAGLGLALAKQWAEVLGGTVAYRAAEGAPGACFRLELPIK
ncbi:sensor histidine kinase [Frigoriglobus tundricola]|uniref:histidine kinase n=1 Tax=Frigoriglobus tundricola TaxID=2774151 RepID=A0A6M5YM43_9BACT|nr:HAMP domain-containing sensor histidine kinase [Frigoriglobus tundricola]QJW94420.1 hypothetical protein FTUN_1940 [Frigoriglobus tundricola]